jgi:hypothetical protein
MDQRVFGPYYGTPPETRGEPTAIEVRFQQDLRLIRLTLRQRLLPRRKHHPPTRM